MINYTITTNAYNNREISIDAKPSEAVLDALKALKMCWNPKKSVWVGIASAKDILSAIQSTTPAEERAHIFTDGYLGATEVHGSKSNRNLYGADLSAAIRADLKKAGIKNVSVRCNSHSLYQVLQVTAKIKPEEFIPAADFIANYDFTPKTWFFINDNDNFPMRPADYYNAPAEEQQKIREQVAENVYNRVTTREINLSNGGFAPYSFLTPDARKKLEIINEIICAYRYDKSNGEVDYFCTNFYYDLYIKPAK